MFFLNRNLVVEILVFHIIFSIVPCGIAQNLILNPGCEDSLMNGEIPYWEEIVGTNWTQRKGDPIPYEGDNYFFAGVAATAELRQDVDVSIYVNTIDNNTQLFTFSGYVHSWNQSPPDLSRIVIEFLDSKKTTVIDSFDSGNYSNTSTWEQISETITAPSGTRFIRIRLISTRRAGSNNDGYFDDLSLIASNPSSVGSDEIIHPKEIRLSQNYPNPFNTQTTIHYELSMPSKVTIRIFNVVGQQVQVHDAGYKENGTYNFVFDASNLTTGIYFYCVDAGFAAKTGEMLYVK